MTLHSPSRISDIPSLQQWLTQRLTRICCVSFDVFDTLVARCIEPPDAIQRRVAEILAERLGGMAPEHVLSIRREAETQLRHTAQTDGLDHECHYDPLVDQWIIRLVGHSDKTLEDFVHTTERKLESLALSAKPGVIELLKWLRDKGLRVIAVSDMYLSHAHLAALLDQCGFTGLIDKVYVSSEFGLGKYSGRLHAKVLELEKLDPGQIVHVGDNLISDMHAPIQQGIEAVFLDEQQQRLRRRRQVLSAEMASQGGMWTGRHFFEAVDIRMSRDTTYRSASTDFFYHYGAHILGSAFSTFILGLVEKSQTIRPDRVYFLARDGYLFYRMYKRWRELEPDQYLPDPVYIYTSRRVVATASIANGLSHEHALVSLYNPKQQGLLSILKTFGLPVNCFADLAQSHGFKELNSPLYDWQDVRLKAFLADTRVQDIVRPIGLAARDRLQRYFEQQGFFDCKRAALIDIGWNGTIQKFLRDSFGQRPDYPDVYGWYFAFIAAMHGDFGMGDRIEGLIHDVRHGNPYERSPIDFEEIFEQGARSGEGTTLGYHEHDGWIVPELKDDASPDRRDEIVCNPLISRFQDGVLSHLEHFHAVWRLTGYNSNDIKSYVHALLERAVAYPSREEVAEIGRLVHTEDFGHDHTLDIAITPISYVDLLRPHRLYQALRNRAWKFSAFANFSTVLPAWLFRLSHLKARH